MKGRVQIVNIISTLAKYQFQNPIRLCIRITAKKQTFTAQFIFVVISRSRNIGGLARSH